MRKIVEILFFLFLALLVPFAEAQNHGSPYWQNEPYDQRGNPNYRYTGSSGQMYQYDLSKPTDRMRYQLDYRAQMRDQLYAPIKPSVDLDRFMHQRGGGVK